MNTFCYSQELAILNGSSISITNGTIFSINGIALTPNSNYNLNGPIEFSSSSTALDPQSINKVFNFSNPLNSYQGNLTFFYEDGAELNGVTESNLILQTKNGPTWSGNIGAILDTGANTLTYNFTSATNISSITASANGTTLSIHDFKKLKINLYPNPTTSDIKINTDLKTEVIIYNLIGQEILKTTNKNIDMSQLSKGTYIFIVKDIATNNFNSYKVLKI